MFLKNNAPSPKMILLWKKGQEQYKVKWYLLKFFCHIWESTDELASLKIRPRWQKKSCLVGHSIVLLPSLLVNHNREDEVWCFNVLLPTYLHNIILDEKKEWAWLLLKDLHNQHPFLKIGIEVPFACNL